MVVLKVPYSRLFILSEPGPTSFVLRGEASARKFRVSVGEAHGCSFSYRSLNMVCCVVY